MSNKMSSVELVKFLSTIKGCEFVVADTTTNVRMNKTNNPYYNRVTKKVSAEYMFNAEYESAVNRRLKKEGFDNNFKSEGLKYGEWVEYKKVLTHKGELYIRLYPLKNKVFEQKYYIDNRLATPEEVATLKEFLPNKSESKKQKDYGLDENKQLVVTQFNFKSINRLRIHKKEIEIIF